MTAFDEAFQILKQNFRISNLPPHIRARNLPDMSPQRFIDEGLHRVGAKNYTRDFMPGPSRYDDEGFPEYDGEDLGPPYGKPEFGDEEARQAEMEDAERAAIMAEGVPEMPRPRGAPRPGDLRFADPNKPRPKYPRDIFGKAWNFLKADRPLGCPNCEGKIDEYTGEPSFPIPNEDRRSSTGYRCWKCGSEI